MTGPVDPDGSGNAQAFGGAIEFSLILLPVDVLNKMHKDFSGIVGSHLADHVFYQTGYRCGEMTSHQYRDFSFEGQEKIKIIEEMINQSAFGRADITETGGNELEILLTDAGENMPAIRPPGLIFAAGFIAGFATALGDVRYRCIWDTPENEGAKDRFILQLAGVPKAGAILGKQLQEVLKGGDD